MRIRASDVAVLIIEINPRYWGSIEGSLYAGVNFPYLALRASQGETFAMPDYRDGRYMSAFTAIKRKVRRKPALSLFHETNFLSSMKDPLPVIMRLVNSL
jgi:predicted ATP-grasp superfamily ATP-dependent carboligase